MPLQFPNYYCTRLNYDIIYFISYYISHQSWITVNKFVVQKSRNNSLKWHIKSNFYNTDGYSSDQVLFQVTSIVQKQLTNDLYHDIQHT